MARYAQITGWGKYLPRRTVTNQELESRIDTSDAWIRERTGIGERRIADDQETTSDMAVQAARQALNVAGLAAEDLDLVIVATVTPERIFPACASVVQNALGARKAGAFDLNAACTGFIYAFATGSQFITSGTFNNVLVIGSEIYSRILDWTDRNTCVLFGDGAGAVVVQGSDTAPGVLSLTLGSDGSGADMVYVPGPCGPAFSRDGHYYLAMNGREVFRFAINIMEQATRQAVAGAGLEMSDIELIIPHQANSRIIKAVMKKGLGIPESRIFENVDCYGNTSAASIPIALCEAVEQGRLKEGDHVALVGFGGGLSWGATVIRWSAGETARGKGQRQGGAVLEYQNKS